MGAEAEAVDEDGAARVVLEELPLGAPCRGWTDEDAGDGEEEDVRPSWARKGLGLGLLLYILD